MWFHDVDGGYLEIQIGSRDSIWLGQTCRTWARLQFAMMATNKDLHVYFAKNSRSAQLQRTSITYLVKRARAAARVYWQASRLAHSCLSCPSQIDALYRLNARVQTSLRPQSCTRLTIPVAGHCCESAYVIQAHIDIIIDELELRIRKPRTHWSRRWHPRSWTF